MVRPLKLNELSATATAKALARREISAEDLLCACLERIDAREEAVGAWMCIDRAAAIETARALDAGPLRGPLHGLPVGVKDIIDTFDLPTAYGSRIYAGHRSPWDAACVASARAAGAVIVGKTVSTEFATYRPGKTANPRNLEHTPGGSSSGSAAAVADAMVPLAYGTQTAGSVIRPAAFCGIVGFKPSFGLIPRAGVKTLAESLDTIGVFAREVDDAALFAGVLAGRDWPVGQVVSGVRVGLCRTYEWDQAEAETQTLFEAAGRRLATCGWRVGELALSAGFADLVAVQTQVMAYEVAQALGWEWLAHGDQLSAQLQQLLVEGMALPAPVHDANRERRRAAVGLLEGIFADVDVILTLSTPGEAPHGLQATGSPLFNRVWTLLGAPCIHLPCACGPNGLPLGLQLVGKPGADAKLLNFASQALRDLRA